MKKLVLVSCMILLHFGLLAATPLSKIAVFNCQSVEKSLDLGKSIAVRELISASLINNNQIIVLNHSEVEEAIQSLQLSTNGPLTEGQMIEVGKKVGADKIIASIVSPISDSQALLSLKLIDVKESVIENQSAKVLEKNQVFKTIPLLVSNLFDNASAAHQKHQVVRTAEKVAPTPANQAIQSLTIRVADGIQFKMMKVEGGKFVMGGDKEKDINVVNNELPAHNVTLSSYYIGEMEVTNELYYALIDSRYPIYADKKLPVVNVNQKDINKFIQLLNEKTGMNFSLPTEAQWEFAARGGNNSKGYIFSGSNNPNNVAWHSAKALHPVGQKEPNELGIYDMSGNAWEWCLDSYALYYTADEIDPRVHTDYARKVVRGGSWWNDSRASRITRRIDAKSSSRDHRIGFRLCMPAE